MWLVVTRDALAADEQIPPAFPEQRNGSRRSGLAAMLCNRCRLLVFTLVGGIDVTGSDLLLDLRSQPRDRAIPLVRYSHQIGFGLANRSGADGESTLPANTPAVNDAGIL